MMSSMQKHERENCFRDFLNSNAAKQHVNFNRIHCYAMSTDRQTSAVQHKPPETETDADSHHQSSARTKRREAESMDYTYVWLTVVILVTAGTLIVANVATTVRSMMSTTS